MCADLSRDEQPEHGLGQWLAPRHCCGQELLTLGNGQAAELDALHTTQRKARQRAGGNLAVPDEGTGRMGVHRFLEALDEVSVLQSCCHPE